MQFIRRLQKYIQKIEPEYHENVFLKIDIALSKFNFYILIMDEERTYEKNFKMENYLPK